MGKIIAVASGKGGTGKTTTVAALSSCLASLGNKTLCVDFDIGLENLDLALCTPETLAPCATDLIELGQNLLMACNEHHVIPDLFFLTPPAISEVTESIIADAATMFAEIRREFDYCIVDSPPGIGAGFELAHSSADMSLIVTAGELPAMINAQRAASAARAFGVDDVRLLVNRVLPKNLKKIRMSIDDIVDSVGARLIGIIPEDKAVYRSLHERIPLTQYKERRAAYNYFDVARRIMGEDVPMQVNMKHSPVLYRSLIVRRPKTGWDNNNKLPKNLVGSYGNPNNWAVSTIAPSDDVDLVKVFKVREGGHMSGDSVRNRMWLHDILDDEGIPYHIEIEGDWAGRRKYEEVQHIFVEESKRKDVCRLIREFIDPGSIVEETMDNNVSIRV